MEGKETVMRTTSRGRKHLNKQDKEEIKRRIQKGESPETVAQWYDIAPFTAMKIAGKL